MTTSGKKPLKLEMETEEEYRKLETGDVWAENLSTWKGTKRRKSKILSRGLKSFPYESKEGKPHM